jgi:hypothetical protein
MKKQCFVGVLILSILFSSLNLYFNNFTYKKLLYTIENDYSKVFVYNNGDILRKIDKYEDKNYFLTYNKTGFVGIAFEMSRIIKNTSKEINKSLNFLIFKLITKNLRFYLILSFVCYLVIKFKQRLIVQLKLLRKYLLAKQLNLRRIENYFSKRLCVYVSGITKNFCFYSFKNRSFLFINLVF